MPKNSPSIQDPKLKEKLGRHASGHSRLINNPNAYKGIAEAYASIYEKKGDCVDKKDKGAHNCAKKVCHEEYGEGECIFGQHAVPDENGFVSHYDVEFEHVIVENVPVEDLTILEGHVHENHEHEGEMISEEEVDVFDIIKGYLIDEGYADSEESALAIMANLTEEQRTEILEGCK